MAKTTTVVPKNVKKSTKPGTADDAGKKQKEKKAGRIVYPGLFRDATPEDSADVVKDGKVRIELDGVPADYDIKKHKPLLKKDFKNESHFWLLRAELAKKAAERFEKMAKECESLGNKANSKTAKQLLNMQRRIAELTAQMAKDDPDFDIEAMINSMREKAQAKIEEETTTEGETSEAASEAAPETATA